MPLVWLRRRSGDHSESGSMSGSDLPLAGVTVVDFSRLFPGNYGTLLLSSLGADVIKVEDTGRGDGIRDMLVFPDQPQSAGHVVLNRGKRSISVDLKSAEGQAVVLKLIGQADVLVDSFRPGVLDRLGLGSEVLATTNPKLVHVSITAFGSTGGYQSRPAHDLNSVGYAGYLTLVKDSEGNATMPRLQNADLSAGMHTALAVLAGLRVVQRDGSGFRADISMAETAASLLPMQLSTVAGTGQSPPSPDFLTGRLACYDLYEAADGGWITVAGLEAKFFVRMCELLGRPELAELQYDPNRQDELRDALAEIFASEPRDHWMDLLAAQDTCVGPALSLTEALEQPHLVERGAVTTAKISDGKAVDVFRVIPWEQRTDNGDHAPELGEHSEAVLTAIGVTPQQVAELIARGVVRPAP